MKYIEKDEIYSWIPASFPDDKDMARAQIPDDLFHQLEDALQYYRNTCIRIGKYLKEHPDDEFKI
jgi:hypothetical protein